MSLREWYEDAATQRRAIDATETAQRVSEAAFRAVKVELETWRAATGAINDHDITTIASDAALAARNAFWATVR